MCWAQLGAILDQRGRNVEFAMSAFGKRIAEKVISLCSYRVGKEIEWLLDSRQMHDVVIGSPFRGTRAGNMGGVIAPLQPRLAKHPLCT